MNTRMVLFSLTLMLGAVTQPVSAQNERSVEVRKRNDCRLAAQVLSTGHPRPHYDWARVVIVNCRDEGPVYLAREWDNATADTVRLRQLIAASRGLRDVRLYVRLRALATDRTKSDLVRAAALLALASYADPQIAVDVSEVRPPDGPITRIPFRGGSAMDFAQVQGAQPLGPVKDEVRVLISALAADRVGEPRPVWYAASVLLRHIQ